MVYRRTGVHMNLRATLKPWIPPALMTARRRWLGHGLRFAGRPTDWAEAERMSNGYAADLILQRVIDATRAVLAGRARFERDSVLFDTPDLPHALLSALMRAGALNGGHLDVIDFGGSLGSTYRQCRPFLEGVVSVRWWVVEQAAFVAAGLAEFTTQELHFAHSMAEIPPLEHAIILASSVLQYLEDPGSVLDEFALVPARHLVIDRTPLSDTFSDRLCLQHVPASIYQASYPCWIFARQRLIERLTRHWRIVSDFPCAEGRASTDDAMSFEFRGFILEKKS